MNGGWPRCSRCGLRAFLAGLAAATWVLAPSQAATFDDGAGGATCRFYAAAGRLEWRHLGGDWLDADGLAQGQQPFAITQVSVRSAPQAVVLDLSKLVARWQRGDPIATAVLLRGIGVAAGVVNLASREADRGGPRLILEWDDGSTDELSPSADTYFACPSQRSLGSEPLLKVGAIESALLEFPFVRRPHRELREAKLILTSPKQYGRNFYIGAFVPQRPESGTGPSEAGISDALVRDTRLSDQDGVLYVEDFEHITRWHLLLSDPTTRPSLATVSADPENGFEPIAGKALRVTIRRGTSQALNHQFAFAELPGGEPDEAYFRYHLRLGSNWDPVVDGGKLPGFAGTYGRAGWGQRRADGSNGWSARGAFMRAQDGPEASPRRAVGTYVYTAATAGGQGEVWGWNLGPTGLLEKNRWYAIEQHVRLNAPGRTDGVLKVWVDGQLAFSRTDMRYRDVPTLRIESLWLNVFHGGVSKTDRDLTLYMDNLVISRRYIGPGRFSP